ncbi:MAG: SDR family NAD(P)-dependent oxidoreductase [Planctomycetota bacterium]
MSQAFDGKVAVVTGAAGTLCSAIARNLAERGVSVVLVGRTIENLEAVREQIERAGGRVLVAAADVTDESAVYGVREKVMDAFGPCDLLINGAGGNQSDALTTKTTCEPGDADVEDPDELRTFFNLNLERFQSVLTINTMGTVIPSRVFGADMAKAGRGVILNFASMNTYRPLTRVAAYAMSKAAISNFTQWLAVHLAPSGVRVNAVAPGFFVNDRSRKILMTEDGGLSPRGQQVMSHTPQQRFGEAEDLLGGVRWLLDDEASAFVTGQTLNIDGGFLAHAGV